MIAFTLSELADKLHGTLVEGRKSARCYFYTHPDVPPPAERARAFAASALRCPGILSVSVDYTATAPTAVMERLG